MPSSVWWAASGERLVPEGLILGLPPGQDAPEDWDFWTAANGLFLRGTTSDTVVGTTGSRSSISIGVNVNGSHNSGPGTVEVKRYGYKLTGTNNMNSPSAFHGPVGGHAGHVVPVTYIPPRRGMVFIKASADTVVPMGAIMFATQANNIQNAYNVVVDQVGLLYSTSAYDSATQSVVASTSSSASDHHSHIDGTSRPAWGLASNHYQSAGGTGGGSHWHGAGSISASHDIARIMMRAYRLVSEKIDGLIGMWAGTGVPEGWSVVAEANERFVQFSSNAVGGLVGTNKVTINGWTASQGHSHQVGAATTGYDEVSGIWHSGTVYHAHSFSGVVNYLPERFNIKFIRSLI